MLIIRNLILLVAIVLVASCAKLGTKSWFEGMKQKFLGDWTFNEAKTYASKCEFGQSKIKKDKNKDKD